MVASLCTALSSVMATKGMKDTGPDTANLILTGAQTVVLTLMLLGDIPPMNFAGLLWFALSGVLGSFIGRILTFQSYKAIGVSTTSTIVGTSPLVVTILVILFLGEPSSVQVFIGSLLVVGGIALINMKDGRLSLTLGSIKLPMGASIMFAVSNILRKMGTDLIPHGVLGAQFSTLAGLAAGLVYMGVRGTLTKIKIDRDNGSWLVGAGVINAVAWVALTSAISMGRVSVMTAIVYSYPLFSVLLARLLLRDSESLTRFTVAGCVLIVFGVVLVSILG